MNSVNCLYQENTYQHTIIQNGCFLSSKIVDLVLRVALKVWGFCFGKFDMTDDLTFSGNGPLNGTCW